MKNEVRQIPYHNYPMNMLTLQVITNVICEDGKRRSVTTTGTPDSFFSQPARIDVYYKGKKKTVSGFITVSNYTPEGEEEETYKFYHNKCKKNSLWFEKVIQESK